MRHPLLTLTTGLSASVLLLAGCGGEDSSETAPPTRSPTTTPSVTQPAPATDAYDSVAAIGHSSMTGRGSVAGRPSEDVPANSWVTGTNPAVRSIASRLVAAHPALAGHVANYAQDGSDVTALPGQVQQMVDAASASAPFPDLVLVSTIDNDIRCDGLDSQDQPRYAERLDAVLTSIEQADPDTRTFVVDSWGRVETYARAVSGSRQLREDRAGPSPCDLFDDEGRVRPGAVRRLQRIVDGYFAQVVTVCARHPTCATDGGRSQDLAFGLADLADDGDHLLVSGQAKLADLVWEAMPASHRAGP